MYDVNMQIQLRHTVLNRSQMPYMKNSAYVTATPADASETMQTAELSNDLLIIRFWLSNYLLIIRFWLSFIFGWLCSRTWMPLSSRDLAVMQKGTCRLLRWFPQGCTHVSGDYTDPTAVAGRHSAAGFRTEDMRLSQQWKPEVHKQRTVCHGSILQLTVTSW